MLTLMLTVSLISEPIPRFCAEQSGCWGCNHAQALEDAPTGPYRAAAERVMAQGENDA